LSSPPTKAELIDKLKHSPSYIRAYEDIEFIHREELRPVRLQLELLKPELVMNEHHIHSTIVVFGSARIPGPDDARRELEKAERELSRSPDDEVLKHRVRVAERLVHNSRYYGEARNFARVVSSTCQENGRREFVIVTGGGPGIMEAANRGAFDVGAKSIGLNITLPHEQEPNPFVSPELCFLFHYFAIRKMHFLLRARALVVFPGGYGTFDELFETLTLIQNEKMQPVPIILFNREFWEKAINLDFLVDEGVISPGDKHLLEFVETADEAWQIILDHYGGLSELKKRTR
jgi:hypothetical protein